MSTLNQIIMNLNPPAVLLALILMLLLVIFFWLAVRQKRLKLTARFSALQKELEHSRKKSKTLTKKNRKLESQIFFAEFRDESIYLITAKHTIDLAGELHTYGLVRTESHAIMPFFTNQRMDHLHVNDFITCVRDELVKIGKNPAGAAFDQENKVGFEPDDSRETELETVENDPWAGHDMIAGASIDQTVMFDKTSESFENLDELYAGFPYLEILTGNDPGAIHYLMFGRFSIGRGEPCNFTLKDDGASKVHCEIVYENQNFVLKDRQSTNGTFRNEVQVRDVTLNFGDTIRVGSSEMKFTCKGFELKEKDPVKAISLFEKCLQREPDFMIALKHLAFLMERDIARQKYAKPLWDRIKTLESSQSVQHPD